MGASKKGHKAMIDRYGRIKVRVTEDRIGNVLLEPISPRRQREVAKSNAYDGSYTVYMENSQQIEQFMADFPRATWINDHNGQREINDGVVILMDTWTYRHMVGGQID